MVNKVTSIRTVTMVTKITNLPMVSMIAQRHQKCFALRTCPKKNSCYIRLTITFKERGGVALVTGHSVFNILALVSSDSCVTRYTQEHIWISAKTLRINRHATQTRNCVLSSRIFRQTSRYHISTWFVLV